MLQCSNFFASKNYANGFGRKSHETVLEMWNACHWSCNELGWPGLTWFAEIMHYMLRVTLILGIHLLQCAVRGIGESIQQIFK